MRRGELWWAAPTLPGGSRKRRPFLVVSHDVFNSNDRWRKVLVVHLTTARGEPSTSWQVAIPRGVAGLPSPSVAKCAEVYTLFKEDLAEAVGTLPREYMVRVDAALSLALGLPEGH
jgi:mRNA-degrading endonuclease toxin of MazEF toxin-antitoxin module